MVNIDDLKKCGKSTYDRGYRVVFFYEDKYQVGSWVSDIENFMYDFVKVEPIENDKDIPKFISIDDILDRWIKEDKRLTKVAIYSVKGKLIQEKIK